MATLIFVGKLPGSYMNDDALENVISYATRSHDSKHFLFCGSTCLSGGPSDMANQMCAIQDLYRTDKDIGRRVAHGILIPDDTMGVLFDEADMKSLGLMCCNFFFSMGYQCLFSLFKLPGNSFELHLVINSVSFCNGKKLCLTNQDVLYMETVFSSYLDLSVEERRLRENGT